ncbi:MAG: acyltransferase family protein [Candidatus Thorarchaeota archaeon]
MQEDDLSTQNIDELEKGTYRYFQIDILKFAMIFLVIFDHTFPWALKNTMGVSLWERISIPVFLVIMGFNMGQSFKQSGEKSLRKLYSWNYFKKKFWRFIFPFFILYVISTIIGLIMYNFDLEAMWYGQHYNIVYGYWRWDVAHLLIGILPFYGPGNWFLPVIFWSILIMPLIYKGFSGKLKWSIISLCLCYIVELGIISLFRFIVPLHVSSQAEWQFYYRFTITSLPFMLSAVGLGLWFSRDYDIFSRKNYFLWILFPLSLAYIIAYQFIDFSFGFEFPDYNFLVFPYSAFLVLLALRLLPKKVNYNNIFIKGIKLISKSTYHILLTQILYFGIVIGIYGDHYGASIFGIDFGYDPLTVFLYLLINWAICVPIGCFWGYGENKIRQLRRSRKNL